MSTSTARRIKRLREKELKKFFDRQQQLNLPTENDVAEYILDKARENRISQPINKDKKELKWDVAVNKEMTNQILDLL